MRTGIPSFLITLGTFFVLQGANLGVTKLVTGAVSTPNINQMDGYGVLQAIFASSFKIGPVTLWTTVLWWIAFVALSAWVLQRTKIGNWIYAVGRQRRLGPRRRRPGDQGQGRPVHDGGLLGLVHRHAPAVPVQHLQAGNGVGNEFLYIIAAVWVAALTGGYGNAWGSPSGRSSSA